MSAGGQYYGVELRTGRGTASQVFVNGVSRLPQPAGSATAQSLAIHHDVVPGANRIVVLIAGDATALNRPIGSIPSPGNPELYAKLWLQRDRPLGRTPEAGAEIEDLDAAEWISQDLATVQLPARLEIAFTAGSELRPPVWAAGEPIDPLVMREAASARLVEVAAALAERRFTAYADLVERRYQDLARAYPLGPGAGELRRLDLAQLAAMGSDPGYAVELDADRGWAWQAEAGSRLLVARSRGGGSPLTMRLRDQEPMPLEFGLSMLGKVLQVVR